MNCQSPRACLFLDGLLLAFYTPKKLMEGVSKFLHTFILQLFRYLGVVNANFLKCCNHILCLLNVFFNGEKDSSMIAEVFDRFKWHSVHCVGTDQFFRVQYITIGWIFRACAGPQRPLHMSATMLECFETWCVKNAFKFLVNQPRICNGRSAFE